MQGVPETAQPLANVIRADTSLSQTDREYLIGFFASMGLSYTYELGGAFLQNYEQLLERYELSNGCATAGVKGAIFTLCQNQTVLGTLLEQSGAAGSSQGIVPAFGLIPQQMQGANYAASGVPWLLPAYGAATTESLPMHPQVQALAQQYGLSAKMTERLNTQMMLRFNTFDSDMAALLEALATARNPPGLLVTKIREMQYGTFIGKDQVIEDAAVEELTRKFKLDEQASTKLAQWVATRPQSRREDLAMMNLHLEYSNKPSSKVMQLLGKMFSAIGSKLPPPEFRGSRGGRGHSDHAPLASLSDRAAMSAEPYYRPWANGVAAAGEEVVAPAAAQRRGPPGWRGEKRGGAAGSGGGGGAGGATAARAEPEQVRQRWRSRSRSAALESRRRRSRSGGRR